MAIQTAQLYDAAFAGFIQGVFNAVPTDPVAADYLSVRTSGQAFAAAVDAAIGADAAIITPVDKYTLAHVNLLQSICAGVMGGRYTIQTTFSANTIAAILAIYTEMAAALV